MSGPSETMDPEPVDAPMGRVCLAGEIDLASFERTRELVVGAGRADGVVVDLSAVTFIDSSGLRALIAAANEVEVALSEVPESVERILEITGLNEFFARQ